MYGTGTRSYNRSTEAREMKKQRAEATRRFEQQPLGPPILLPIACACNRYPFPHLHEERQVKWAQRAELIVRGIEPRDE